MPPSLDDQTARPDDDRFRFVTGRRPAIESAVAACALDVPGLTVRRGVAVDGLLTGPSTIDGVPHVIGVRTSEGEELGADLVVDAMGRRTPLATWLDAAGGRAPDEEAESSRFVYRTRYFRGPDVPTTIGPPVVELGTISVLTLPGDNGTWSVTVFGSAADAPLKRLMDPERFERVLRACPFQAHWLDGEPITETLAMAGILDRYRRFVVDGRPVVTGCVAVGDSWACTNPSGGKGISVGLVHAQALRGVVRSSLDDPAAMALEWDEVTERVVTPFFRNQIAADRARLEEMDALRDGRQPPEPDVHRDALGAAAMEDADVFRGLVEIATCLALPDEVLARPGVAAKVEARIGERGPAFPGPTREELLALLA